MLPVVAVDIGGTKIAAARIAEGIVDDRHQVATPAGDADAVWKALQDVLAAALDGGPVRGVGISTAGPIDLVDGTVSPVNIGGWRGFPLVDAVRSDLQDRGLDVPVAMAGDAVCMAWGEHCHGAGRGVDDMMGLVVSTGVGGGLVLGGRPHAGPSGNAGHIGHMTVDLGGEPCACGGRGCVETVASGPSMVRWAQRNGSTVRTAEELAAAARTGDPVAFQAFARAGRALGAAIAGVASVCDARLAVIGGGVAQAEDVLFPHVRAGVAEFGTLGYVRDLEIRRASLGGDAGLVGAAALV